MCLAQGPQRSDAGEAQTRSPSVSSQALYHWATALPTGGFIFVWQKQLLCKNVKYQDKEYNPPYLLYSLVALTQLHHYTT